MYIFDHIHYSLFRPYQPLTSLGFWRPDSDFPYLFDAGLATSVDQDDRIDICQIFLTNLFYKQDLPRYIRQFCHRKLCGGAGPSSPVQSPQPSGDSQPTRQPHLSPEKEKPSARGSPVDDSQSPPQKRQKQVSGRNSRPPITPLAGLSRQGSFCGDQPDTNPPQAVAPAMDDVNFPALPRSQQTKPVKVKSPGMARKTMPVIVLASRQESPRDRKSVV